VLRDTLHRYRLRLSRGLEQQGAFGLVRQAAGRVFSVDEEYVWYALDLERLKPMAFRGEGYELRAVSEDEAELLNVVPAIPVEEGRRRIARGEQLWFVFHEGEPVFACTAFLNLLPLEAARKGRYPLSDGVMCVDDGLTKREYRGRAIAVVAWLAIAERLRDDGYRVMIAKVPMDNIASRRTHEKTGFRPTMVMNRRRRGFRRRVIFRDEGPELTPPERRSAEDLKRTVAR
jgi:GNAT superfamily N-acetyltransferase